MSEDVFAAHIIWEIFAKITFRKCPSFFFKSRYLNTTIQKKKVLFLLPNFASFCSKSHLIHTTISIPFYGPLNLGKKCNLIKDFCNRLYLCTHYIILFCCVLKLWLFSYKQLSKWDTDYLSSFHVSEYKNTTLWVITPVY